MIFRPNATDFQRNVDIITSDDGFRDVNWGGTLGYGGYYGASTIQVGWQSHCISIKALDDIHLTLLKTSGTGKLLLRRVCQEPIARVESLLS